MIDAFLNQTIGLETIYAAAAIDVNGDPSYNTSATHPARIERRIKKIINLQGADAVSNCQIFLKGSVSLDKYGRDRITLPTEMGSVTPPILAIEYATDGAGNVDYIEVDV